MYFSGIKTLFRVGVALLQLLEEQILSTTDLSVLLPLLLHVPHDM